MRTTEKTWTATPSRASTDRCINLSTLPPLLRNTSLLVVQRLRLRIECLADWRSSANYDETLDTQSLLCLLHCLRPPGNVLVSLPTSGLLFFRNDFPSLGLCQH